MSKQIGLMNSSLTQKTNTENLSSWELVSFLEVQPVPSPCCGVSTTCPMSRFFPALASGPRRDVDLEPEEWRFQSLPRNGVGGSPFQNGHIDQILRAIQKNCPINQNQGMFHDGAVFENMSFLWDSKLLFEIYCS